MRPKSSPFLCLFPLAALAACGGQVQGGDGTGNPAPSSSPTTESPPSSPSSAPSSNLPKPTPGECALSGEGFPDALLRTSGPYRELAAYAVVDVKEECSGAGGTHIWLKNLTPSLCGGATLVHLGGHGCMFSGIKLGDTILASSYAEEVSVETPGFCIEKTMPANGRVRAFRALEPNEDLSKLLRAYGCK